MAVQKNQYIPVTQERDAQGFQAALDQEFW
jgi:hypothetical protein